MPTSPEQAIEKIHARFGSHEGHRALHAKGVHCTGRFVPTPDAARLTRAVHMNREVPAKVRFSNGAGDPTVPDYAPDVRGLAVSLQLPDGSATDILAQTLPRFPFPDEEGFFSALEVSERSLRTLPKLIPFLMRYPSAVKSLREADEEARRRAPFAARRYYAFHAFKWLDADGGERFVRYFWHPTVDGPEFSKEEAKRRGPDYLFDELRERLRGEPVRMRLEVQVAAAGDNPDDPSDEWPAERERVIVGTLEVDAIDDEADDGIVFDPMRLTDGIEASKDPVLRYRPAAYSLSHADRT